MARRYVESKFLLGIDDYSLVETYFRSRKPEVTAFSYSKYQNKIDDGQIAEDIGKVVELQPESVQQEIDRDFSAIYNLATDGGVSNLLNQAKDQGVNVPLTDIETKNDYDIALWFFNNHRDVFGRADVEEKFSAGAVIRVPVPTKDLDFVIGKIGDLDKGLKSYYQQEGRGKYCLVESYKKHDRIYIVSYVSDRGAIDIYPDEKRGRLIKGARRPSIEIYYHYIPKDDEGGGTLAVKAKGGLPKKLALLGVFTKSVFNHELDNTKQTYNLDMLRNPNFSFQYDDDDQVEGWWLKRLDLRTRDYKTRVEISVKDEDKMGVAAMWDELRKLHLAEKVQPASGMLISRAHFKIAFTPTDQHPKGKRTFYVTYKNSTDLNANDELDNKAKVILKKSKIDCGFTR